MEVPFRQAPPDSLSIEIGRTSFISRFSGGWERAMLVLSRKPGERILIGNDIVVTVVRFQGGTVRLGIEAPREFAVIREELANGESATETPATKDQEAV